MVGWWGAGFGWISGRAKETRGFFRDIAGVGMHVEGDVGGSRVAVQPEPPPRKCVSSHSSAFTVNVCSDPLNW
jgi:hypothetical protein